jgi:hypothetical protein
MFSGRRSDGTGESFSQTSESHAASRMKIIGPAPWESGSRTCRRCRRRDRRLPWSSARPHACLSLRGFDQQLDANDIAREDATPIQRNGEPHPEGLPIDAAGCRARGADLTGPPHSHRSRPPPDDLGHADIAVLSAPPFTSTATGRPLGARKALRETGIPVNLEWIIETTFGSSAPPPAVGDAMDRSPNAFGIRRQCGDGGP